MKKVYLALLATILYSCESVIWVDGIVTDTCQVPLDSVVVSCHSMNVRTDSLGKFRYMKVVGGKTPKEADFLFSKKGFVRKSQRLTVNSSKTLIITLQREYTL